jgi:hypothetical protein
VPVHHAPQVGERERGDARTVFVLDLVEQPVDIRTSYFFDLTRPQLRVD